MGTSANSLSQAGVTFQPGVFRPDTSADGLDLPGTEKWRVDSTAPLVTVDHPGLYGRGFAPSGDNALNALFQPVIVLFPASTDLTGFSAKLDNDTFGDARLSVSFYDANDRLLSSLPLDQTVPGYTVSSGTISGVSKLVLPGGAFYDNVNVGISTVPEPSTWALLGVGLAALGWFHRRRS